MKEISVIGHKNPDTDCTLSAVIMAEYLEKKWYKATPYIQWSLNKETLYILKKYNIPQPEVKTELDTGKEVCLIDHNELSQWPDNYEELDITWLVDHHKLSFKTPAPIHIRIEPLCSTASILYKMFLESNFEISRNTAILMLACIMSDSLLWKSPTTTTEDQEIAKKLQEIADINNLEDFAMPMFDAKSDLWDLSAKELVLYDYKIFEWEKYKYGSWALETTSPDHALWRKEEILTALQEVKEEQWLDFIMLSVVDILWEKNITLTLEWNDSKIIEDVFNTQVSENLSDLGARVSRKKQIIPYLTEYFNSHV